MNTNDTPKVRTLTEAWVRDYQLPAGVERERWFDVDVTGFGVMIGKRSRTFIARHRVNGQRRDVTIGQRGAPGPDGQPWTVVRARKAAREAIGGMIAGVDPVANKATATDGPTLGDAFDAHAEALRKKIAGGKRSTATLASFEKSRKKIASVAPEVLATPITEVTGELLTELYEQAKASATVRAGSVNDAGTPMAVRMMRNVSAAWGTLNKRLDGKLGNWNPAKSVEKDVVKPKRQVVDDLPGWWARVQTMKNPIHRDGITLALFTGLRSADVRSIRVEHVDLEEGTLELPSPKGGAHRAFTIPLCETVIAIIERRIADNHRDLGGRDAGGWVFPAIDSDGKVGPLGDLREQRTEAGTKVRFPAEDVHSLRRTFLTIAQEVGVSELDQHVLSNHAFGGQNVNATYIRQHIDHLATCVAKIEAGIKARISPDPTKAKKARGRRKLRAA